MDNPVDLKMITLNDIMRGVIMTKVIKKKTKSTFEKFIEAKTPAQKRNMKKSILIFYFRR